MPNPLWEMQGLQQPVYGKAEAGGDRPVEKLVLATPGSWTPAQFDQSVRDITAFLEYAGEPAALSRQSLGVWVVLFLAFFTFSPGCSEGILEGRALAAAHDAATGATVRTGWTAPMRPADSGCMEKADDGCESAYA